MKNFVLVVLLVLVCIGGAGYYTYSTNTEFADYVNSQFKNPSVVAFDSAQEKNEITVKPRAGRPRIPKAIKPDKFFRIDEFARKTPKKYEKDIETLAKYLTSVSDSDYEKVRALFTWVATHINYDDDAFNSGKLGDYPAGDVLLRKKAVCEGFSNLLSQLCVAAGFESEKIVGYAKGYGYKEGDKFEQTDHAWNAVKIDGNWRLLDVTWARGHSLEKNGKLVSVNEFDGYWFDVKPKEFIFTHLPESQEWQLIDRPIDLDTYQKLPYLSRTFFKLGFGPDRIFDEAVSGNVQRFAESFSLTFPVKAISMPYERDLHKNDTLNFVIQSDYAESIALIDVSGWHYFRRNGTLFEIKYAPVSSIKISQQINWYDQNYWSIVRYQVK